MKIWTIFVMLILMVTAVMAAPSDVNLTRGASQRSAGYSAVAQNAEDGNVTILNVEQDRVTDIWQGFYGNVSGSIVLENAAGNNFYDWTFANISGEVYASRKTVSSWSTINCSNSTYMATEETSLGITSTMPDGVNETYALSTHPSFTVADRTMTGCPSSRPYTTGGVSGPYWNVLLNIDSTTFVYTSLLTNNEAAFDATTADYEILVPVNRTAGGVATYYFYAELH